jgi:hypothetical protein
LRTVPFQGVFCPLKNKKGATGFFVIPHVTPSLSPHPLNAGDRKTSPLLAMGNPVKKLWKKELAFYGPRYSFHSPFAKDYEQ